MIIEALENKKLPDSLEIATITLLPKPGKDKQKCDSYRPLSLLNADYKILSKLIALRLEDVIPKIIHADQTGFVKNRYGADNVRRLLHILNTAQKNLNPMLIMSMDAKKAFDRIEPSFLFRTLEAMGFGEKFTQYVKTLIGRINTIKMSILPKFTYLFQCLPMNVPKSFFNELNKILTPFIWQRKNPRVKLIYLQAPYSRGGLNLPN